MAHSRIVIGVRNALCMVAALSLTAGCAAGDPGAGADSGTSQGGPPATVAPTLPTPAPAGVVAELVDVGRETLVTYVLAPPTPGPHPVVVFGHGLGSEPLDYRPLLDSWVTAGVAVVAHSYRFVGDRARYPNTKDQPRDAITVLDAVLALSATPSHRLAGKLDGTRVAFAGHSAGAVMASGVADECCRDPRVAAVLLLAGTTGPFGRWTGAPVPLLVVTGTSDGAYDPGVENVREAPWPAGMLTLPDATHITPFESPDDPAFAAVAAGTTAFLAWTLRGDTAALDELRATPDLEHTFR